MKVFLEGHKMRGLTDLKLLYLDLNVNHPFVQNLEIIVDSISGIKSNYSFKCNEHLMKAYQL